MAECTNESYDKWFVRRLIFSSKNWTTLILRLLGNKMCIKIHYWKLFSLWLYKHRNHFFHVVFSFLLGVYSLKRDIRVLLQIFCTRSIFYGFTPRVMLHVSKLFIFESFTISSFCRKRFAFSYLWIAILGSLCIVCSYVPINVASFSMYGFIACSKSLYVFTYFVSDDKSNVCTFNAIKRNIKR